jgi:hypothetical protein
VKERLASTNVKVALLGAGCVVALALAFGLGRATAPGARAAPSLVPIAGSQAGLSLPHLSQALPVPALAAAVARPSRPRATISPVIHRHKASKPGGPVDIVGSG